MLTYLIRILLKLTNKNHLIQFLDGLSAIGKPTQVLYPGELLEQAALLGLSGLNNTLAIHSNQNWIWPYWVERQLNPDSDDFIPTGVNLLTNNLSFRNWTALSIPGNRLEAMIDPVGMLTMEPFSWSIMPYLIIDQNYHVPAKMDISSVKQTLHKNKWPEVITCYKTSPDIQWISKSKTLDINQQQILQQKFIIKNKSSVSRSLTFGISLRPYNSLTIGHIHKLTCKKNLWKINGNPAVLMLKSPDFIYASNRLLGDPVFLENQTVTKEKTEKVKLISRSGISTGIAIYEITLLPGEQRSFQFLCSDKQSSALSIKKKNSEWKTDINNAEKLFRQNWKQWSKKGLNIYLPDKEIKNSFYAVKNHLNVFDDVEQFTPGSFFYHTGWFRDSAFLSLGFDQVGFFDQVENKFKRYFKLQTFKGYFKSQGGEWDSTGQALFTVISHIRRTGKTKLLSQYYPALMKGAKWINKVRLTQIDKSSPHYGLLPAGLSAEHFGPNDHYYWDNFWSLAGIKQLIWCAQYLNKEVDKKWLQELFDQYSRDLQKSIDDVSRRTEHNALPCSPYRWMDTAAIGNLAAITPMHVVSSDQYWVKPSLDFLWQNNVRNGLFFQHIIHSGLNIYLSIQLAKLFLIHQDPRWKVIFRAILDKASPTWTWPEAIHPKTGGGCMGDGDHGWAAAEFISLIRHIFIFEHNESLYLGAGIFSEWFEKLDTVQYHHDSNQISSNSARIKKSKRCIELENASTLYGTVSYTIEKYHQDIVLKWTISRNELQTLVPAYFICPELINHYLIEDQDSIVLNHSAIELRTNSGEFHFKFIEHNSNTTADVTFIRDEK